MTVISPTSFAGVAVNDATYRAWFPGDGATLVRQSAPVILDVIGGYPREEGADQKSASFFMAVAIKAPAEATYVARVDALKQTFRVGRSGALLVNWDGADRVRDVIVEGFYPLADPGIFQVQFIAADPRWRAPTQTTATASLTATGQSVSITNAGNATDDRPVIIIKPTAQKSATVAWKYRRYAVVANRVKRALTDWPIEVTNGGINHGALVTAGKSQTDGDDVRVLVDGVEAPRYFGEHVNNDPNSTLTKVWVTVPFSAMAEAHLLTAITNVSPANGGEIEVRTRETLGWPTSGWMLIGNEVVSYSGWTDANASGHAAFTGIKRAQMGTTAASGSVDAQIIRVEHKIELIYGHTGVVAPEARPSLKPLLDLTSNTLTNIRHEWGYFYDDQYPSRPGGWTRSVEARDAQAGFLFANRGSPAATADFVYNYYNPPVDRDNFNVLSRGFPAGTSGAAGQVALTRVVDASLMAEIRGVLDDGSEHLLASLRGPLTSATFTSAFLQKLYSLTIYTRSQVVISTPEMDGSPLADQMGSSSYYAQVNAVNTVGNIYGAYVNGTTDLLRIAGVQILAWQPGTPKVDITVSVRADDGTGAPSGNQLAIGTIPSASVNQNPLWLNVGFARPFPWAAGQKIHLNVQSGATSSSNTLWGHQPMEHASAFPMRAARWLSDGEIVDYARAEGGGGTLYAPAAGDNTTFDNAVALLDSAGVPYFALAAEQDCYWLNPTVINEITNQELKFNAYVATNDQVEVDVGARTVTNLTTGENFQHGMEPSDADGWLSVTPGFNTIRVDEAGLAGADITVRAYSRWE